MGLVRIYGRMSEATATVRIDDRGRLVVPQPARQKIGVDGEERVIEITVSADE